MKNRLAIACAIAVLCGGLVYVSDIPSGNRTDQEVAQLDYANSVTGTGLNSMTGAPAAWTVIALPKNYKTDSISQEVLQSFATEDSLLELRKNTEVRVMVEGDPLLGDGGPLEGIKWFPAVCVINTQGKLLYKSSGGYACGAARDIADEGINEQICKPLYAPDPVEAKYDYANGLFNRRFNNCSNNSCDGIKKRLCPSCPKTTPKSEPVVDRPETPEIPDTPRVGGPTKEEDDHFVVFAVLVGCVAGVISYFRQ